MASQLHQAVELAQAGRRDEARQLFLSYLQTNPDHEVAWLWLASVAVTQAEYQHALNQVLRINPANERAQRLLDEFQRQQYGAPMAPPAPPAAPPVMPQAPPVYPPPYAAEPRWEPPAEERRYAAPAYGEPPRPQPVEVEVREVRRRGCLPGLGCMPGCLGCTGCGGPGCLLALLVLVVLPFVVLGALSYGDASLGPIDWLATYLPGEFGRKTVSFEGDASEITVEVPRSWYLAEPQGDSWSSAAFDLAEAIFPFRDDTRQWEDFEVTPNERLILETHPAVLSEAGDLIRLAYQGTMQGSFECSSVRQQQTDADAFYPDGNLCGYRRSSTESGPADQIFRAIDPPATTRVISFVVPVSESSATQWELRMPEESFARFEDDIDALIESVRVTGAVG